jgi:inner membrane protein
MMFLTHLAVGLVAALFFSDSFTLGALVALLLGTLLPDIDSTRSFLGSKVPVFGWVFRHRGLFHSLPLMAVLAYITYAIAGKIIAISFSIGFVLHLALDSLTREGTTPFFPFEFRIRGPFGTGGLMDYALLSTSAALAAFIYLN